MNKALVLSVLVACIALSAGRSVSRTMARDVNNGQQRLEQVQRQAVLSLNSDDDITSRRGRGSKKLQGSGLSGQSLDFGDVFDSSDAQALVFDPTVAPKKVRGKKNRRGDKVKVQALEAPGSGLRRRGNGIVGAQRAIQSQNVATGASAGEGAVAQDSLKAGVRDLDAMQALLEQKQAKQERVDAKAERQARRKDAGKFAAGEQLAVQSALAFEETDYAEKFHDVDAEAAIDIGSELALQIVANTRHQEQAAIAENFGERYGSGLRLRAEESLAAEAQVDEEFLSADEAVDNEALSAAGAFEDILNAKEEARVENEEFIDTQSFQQGQRAFGAQNDFFGGRFGIGNRSPFSNSIF